MLSIERFGSISFFWLIVIFSSSTSGNGWRSFLSVLESSLQTLHSQLKKNDKKFEIILYLFIAASFSNFFADGGGQSQEIALV